MEELVAKVENISRKDGLNVMAKLVTCSFSFLLLTASRSSCMAAFSFSKFCNSTFSSSFWARKLQMSCNRCLFNLYICTIQGLGLE